METPTEQPQGPRGPRTTAPEGDPLKAHPEEDAKDREEGGREEQHRPEPSRPHGDPLREQIAR